MRKCYLLGLFVLLAVSRAFSQDSTKTTTLQEIVVSATRTEQPVIEVARSVTVIGKDKINSSIYQSVGELLNAESGLFIVGTNQTPGTNQNIFMRGANSNQVAVLVDGVRITDPSSPNAAIDFSEISLTNVERIEILRGSHSTLFGGAAVGGVINIITRKGSREGFHGDASLQGGSFGRRVWSSSENANLTYGTSGGFYVSGSLFRQDVGGLDATPDNPGQPSFTSDRDDFRKTDAMLKAGYENDRWDISTAFRNAHQYTEIDDGAFRDDENSYLEFGRRLVQYSVRYQINPLLDLHGLGSFSYSERFYEDDSSRVSPTAWDGVYGTGTYYGRLQTHELQLTYRGSVVRGIVGAGMYRERMNFDNYLFFNDPLYPFELVTNYDTLDTRTTTAYLFARAGYRKDHFDVSVGARFNEHTEVGNFVTFDFSPSYNFGELLVYGSLSTGFNPPSLYQLYDPARNFGAFATRGNSSLDAEKSVSVEVGVKKQFTSGAYLTLSGYQMRVTNSIEYVYLWSGDRPVAELTFEDDRGDRYVNVGEQEVRGLELDGLVRLSKVLSLSGNLSFLKARILATPEDVDPAVTGGHHVQLYNFGKFLTADFEESEVVRRPTLTAFASLRYAPLEKLTFRVAYRYTGERFDAEYDGTLGPYGALSRTAVGTYTLLDVDARWEVSNALSFALKVENILDEPYREVIGFQTRGRSVYLKAMVRF